MSELNPDDPTGQVLAPCDHCGQTRPVWAYRPDHHHYHPPDAMACRWCSRDAQPLLCVRCWGRERLLEERKPATAAEKALARMVEANARHLARQDPSDG